MEPVSAMNARMSASARCKGCGSVQPMSVMEQGYCPGCAQDYLCSSCGRECDPSSSLCDDCLDAEREAREEPTDGKLGLIRERGRRAKA
jgi:hypothetical protein